MQFWTSTKPKNDGLYIGAIFDGQDWNYSIIVIREGKIFAPFVPTLFHKIQEPNHKPITINQDQFPVKI